MKRILWMSLCLLGCRTVGSGYQSTTSSVTVNLPANLGEMSANAVFKKVGATDETNVKGKDLKVRLPRGDYKVGLRVFDKYNVEQYSSCDPEKVYKIEKPKESLVIDICKPGSGEVITRTVPDDPDKDSDVDVEVKEDKFRSGKVVVNGVYVKSGASCFGQEPLPKVENGQIVMKLKDPVRLIDLQDDKASCDFGVEFKKPSGKIYLPLKAAWTFDADETTAGSEIFISEQLNFSNNSSIVCSGILLEKAPDLKRISTCSLWKDPVARGAPIRQRTFSNICAVESNYLDLKVRLRPLGEKEEITKLDLKEIRIDLPQLETCMPTGERPEVDPKELLLACTKEGVTDGVKCRACEDKFEMTTPEFKDCLKK